MKNIIIFIGLVFLTVGIAGIVYRSANYGRIESDTLIEPIVTITCTGSICDTTYTYTIK